MDSIERERVWENSYKLVLRRFLLVSNSLTSYATFKNLHKDAIPAILVVQERKSI